MTMLHILIYVIIFTFLIFGSQVNAIAILSLSTSEREEQPTPPSSCVTFDSEERVITITCRSINLTEINTVLKDPDVLRRDEAVENGWILNAGIIVTADSLLYINSTDTSWLKIIPDEETSIANGLQVHGNLKIDSIKISSWDPETDDYVMFEVLHKPREEGAKTDYDTVARPYIRIASDSTGTTDITNSELAYLGYEDPDDNQGRSGLLYYGGDGSIIKNNHIHHLRFGFYSSGVGNITIEDNLVAHNYMYGFDPHTGTHDMIIRNNTVYDSGAMGIICSLDCYNVLIEDNEVYNSFGSGIMFSKNMTDSIARNNYVHNENQCIFVSASHNNQVYNNTVSNCTNGIYLRSESSNNEIYNNTIRDTNQGIYVNTGASDNEFKSNTIINATELGININEGDDDDDAGSNNALLDNVLVNAELADTQEEEEEEEEEEKEGDEKDTPDRD